MGFILLLVEHVDLCNMFNSEVSMKVRIKPLRVLKVNMSNFGELLIILSYINSIHLTVVRKTLTTSFTCTWLVSILLLDGPF